MLRYGARALLLVTLACLAFLSPPRVLGCCLGIQDCYSCQTNPCECWKCTILHPNSPCMYCNIFACNCEPCTNKISCICEDNSAAAAERFSEADGNGDGQVSFEELKSWAVKQPPESVTGSLGRLTLREAFDAMDKDRDGIVSLAESGCPLRARTAALPWMTN